MRWIVALFAAMVGTGPRPEAQAFEFEIRYLEVAQGTSRFTLAELTGDGEVDLVLAQFPQNAISILAGDGTGDFTLIERFSAGPSLPSVGTADFDLDGKADLILSYSQLDGFEIRIGNGDGTFLPPVYYPQLRGGIAHDFNSDSRLDLATIVNNDLVILYGRVPGQTAPTQVAGGSGVGLTQGRLAPGADLFEDTLFVYEFTAPPTFPAPTLLSLVDFNGDGILDLGAADANEGIHSLISDGLGGFTHTYSSTFDEQPFGINFVDLDADGDLDAIAPTSGFGDCFLERILNTGGEAFMFDALVAECSKLWSLTHDFNGDGLFDTAFRSTQGLGFLPDVGSIDLVDAVQSFVLPEPPDRSGVSVDIDHDGRLDLILLLGSFDLLAVLINKSPTPAPKLLAATPSSFDAVAPEPRTAKLTGTALGETTRVFVGDTVVPEQDYEVLGPLALRVDLPLLPAVGPVDIRVETTTGAATLPILIRPPSTPVLNLNDGVAELAPTGVALATVGAVPADLFFLFVSPHALPSSLPGQLELGIGNGFQSLVQIASGFIGPSAWSQFGLPLGGLPLGTELYFQASVLEGSQYSLPLVSSNVARIEIVVPKDIHP